MVLSTCMCFVFVRLTFSFLITSGYDSTSNNHYVCTSECVYVCVCVCVYIYIYIPFEIVISMYAYESVSI